MAKGVHLLSILQRFNDGCVCSFLSMYNVSIGTTLNIDLVIAYSFGYGHVIFLYLHMSRVSGIWCSAYKCEINCIACVQVRVT